MNEPSRVDFNREVLEEANKDLQKTKSDQSIYKNKKEPTVAESTNVVGTAAEIEDGYGSPVPPSEVVMES